MRDNGSMILRFSENGCFHFVIVGCIYTVIVMSVPHSRPTSYVSGRFSSSLSPVDLYHYYRSRFFSIWWAVVTRSQFGYGGFLQFHPGQWSQMNLVWTVRKPENTRPGVHVSQRDIWLQTSSTKCLQCMQWMIYKIAIKKVWDNTFLGAYYSHANMVPEYFFVMSTSRVTDFHDNHVKYFHHPFTHCFFAITSSICHSALNSRRRLINPPRDHAV